VKLLVVKSNCIGVVEDEGRMKEMEKGSIAWWMTHK